MKDLDINWALAFACLAFSGTWLVGLGAGVPIETVALRATVGLLLGAGIGLGIDAVVRQLAPLAKAPPPHQQRGSRIDFTTPEETDPKLPTKEGEGDAFQPLDFKATARHVESLTQD